MDSTFDWASRFRSQAKILLILYYCASTNEEFYSLNSQIVKTGHDRIAELLRLGAAEGEFKCKDYRRTAKKIQIVITGAFVAFLTEETDSEIKDLPRLIREQCLSLAGCKE